MRSIPYIFTGVVILVVILVLYTMVQKIAGVPNVREWFTDSVISAPSEPGSAGAPVPKIPAPAAPAPAPPAAVAPGSASD
jgi:hypothetical protein